MQKEIKLGLVVGFALLLAILLVWYKSGEETGKPIAPGSDAIENLLGTGKPAPPPQTSAVTPPIATEPLPLPSQVTPTEDRPAPEVKPTPVVETIEIPKSVPVKAEIGPPPKPPGPTPAPKPVVPHLTDKPVEVAKAPAKPKAEPEKQPDEDRSLAGDKPAGPAAEQTYVVQPGDTLTRIARKFYQDEKKWTLILEANRGSIQTPDTLYVGLKLKIPPVAEKAAPAETAAAKPKPAGKEEAPAADKPAAKEGAAKKYTVQRGDTLSSIAEDHLGDARLWKKIFEANKDTLKEPSDLKTGQVILIPAK